MTEQILQAATPLFIEYVLPGIFIALSWLVGRAFSSLRKKFDGERAGRLLTTLERVAYVVVSDVEQTVVPALKKSAADGKLTEEDAKQALDAAVERMKGMLGKRGLKELRTMMNDMDPDDAIVGMIEAQLGRKKK